MNKKLIILIGLLMITVIALWVNNPKENIFESHSNGNIKLSKQYLNGQPYGTWTSYNADGSMLTEVEFMPGSLIKSFKTYHSNGYVKNSMVALTSWDKEFTKGRDSVRFVIETYDNKGNRIKNKTDGGSVDDIHKGVTYLFPWYDGESVTGFIKTSQTKK